MAVGSKLRQYRKVPFDVAGLTKRRLRAPNPEPPFSEETMTAKASAILTRQLEVRNKLWPDVSDKMTWNRRVRDGFVTMPRSMPLIMRIMDHMAGKGSPVSQVYLDLWCRTFDEAFLQITKTEEMATYAGFSGQRAVRTWKERLSKLVELGFIDIKYGLSKEVQFALILNPYHVIAKAYAEGDVPVEMWNALMVRSAEIGAKDLDDVDDQGDYVAGIKPTTKKKFVIKKKVLSSS